MTSTAERPTVTAVLTAIGKGRLHHLCPAEESRQLAAVVGRVEAGVELTVDDQRAAARLLQSVRAYLDGPLTSMGLGIPAPPDPVARARSTSTQPAVCMLYMLAAGRIGIVSPFALKEVIAGLNGARWDPTRKIWTIPATPASAFYAMQTLAVTGYKARESVIALAESYQESQNARAMLADGAPVPENDGTDVVTMPLWSHQRRGVAFGEVVQAFVAAVKMGGGKTGMAIATANRVQAATVLIVAPNRVRAVWPREVRERSAVAWHIEDGTRPSKRRGGRRQDLQHPERLARLQALLWDCDCGAPVHAFVLNYEALTQRVWQDWTPPHKVDLIIYDEAHRLKQYQTKVPRKRVKGPLEKALPATATEEQVLAARRADAIGPRERAMLDRGEGVASRQELQHARRLDKAEKRAEDQARANRLTVSGVAARWVDWSHRRIALTGTPFPQHPWDIFGLYRAIDPGVFGQVWEPFRDKYVQMDKSNKFPVKIRPLAMREFAETCMSLMYRPKVDLRLPGCTDVLREVELEPDARAAYDQLDAALWADLSPWMREQGPDLDEPIVEIDGEAVTLDEIDPAAPRKITAANILSRLMRLQQLTGGTLRTDEIEGPDGRPMPGPEVRVSHAKTDELAEFETVTVKGRKRHVLTGGVLQEIGCVAGMVTPDGDPIEPEPVIVFCRFTSDLDAVKAVADKAGLRYGEISGRRSDGLNADARMADDVDLVAVNVQAGGTGVDLTRARYAVWYSLGYSVSDYDQARARNYRPGQKRPVVNIHLVARGTKDQAVYDAIKARRDAVAAVLLAGGVDPSEVGIAEEIVPADPNAGRVEGIDDASAAVTLPWEQ